jgi:hypothetical protein
MIMGHALTPYFMMGLALTPGLIWGLALTPCLTMGLAFIPFLVMGLALYPFCTGFLFVLQQQKNINITEGISVVHLSSMTLLVS